MRALFWRLGIVTAALGLVVGLIAVALPSTASSAPSVTAGKSKPIPIFTPQQLITGLMNGVGPVGKLIYGKMTSATPTAGELGMYNAIASALGTTETAEVASELQSGSVTEVVNAFSQIDGVATNALESIDGASAPAAVARAVATAKTILDKSGDNGVKCSGSAGSDPTSCAEVPPFSSPNTDNANVNINVNYAVVAVFGAAVEVIIAVTVLGVVLGVAQETGTMATEVADVEGHIATEIAASPVATPSCTKMTGNTNSAVSITGKGCKPTPPKGYGNASGSWGTLGSGGDLTWTNGDYFTLGAPTVSTGTRCSTGSTDENLTGAVTASSPDTYDSNLVGTTFSAEICIASSGTITLAKGTKAEL